jgi:hypothetical protein
MTIGNTLVFGMLTRIQTFSTFFAPQAFWMPV